jgi:hypothetical protein
LRNFGLSLTNGCPFVKECPGALRAWRTLGESHVEKMLSADVGHAFASRLSRGRRGRYQESHGGQAGDQGESVTKSGYLGLYEVYADGQLFYTDDKMTAIVVGGQLIDAKTMKNVTDERMKKLTAIKFSELPLERAIKQVRGDGKRVMATFEDPNCGYCKRLAKDLLKLENVTVYTSCSDPFRRFGAQVQADLVLADRPRRGTTG